MLDWCCLLLKWTDENVNDTFLFRIRFAGFFKLSGFVRSAAFVGGHACLFATHTSVFDAWLKRYNVLDRNGSNHDFDYANDHGLPATRIKGSDTKFLRAVKVSNS